MSASRAPLFFLWPPKGAFLTTYNDAEYKMPKKQKTLKQILLSPPQLPEVPWNVWTKLGSKHISVFGDQVSFGESDYANLAQIQDALTWYVEQFGGTVKW